MVRVRFWATHQPADPVHPVVPPIQKEPHMVRKMKPAGSPAGKTADKSADKRSQLAGP
jgi:hypothetical protein